MSMTTYSCTLSFLIVISMGSLWLSNARTFYVGGDDGWTLKPSEHYSHWAERNRFQINDSVVFKYKKGHNSVLTVNENGYNKCNKDAPFQSFRDGNSTFKFDKSGTFYFISGHEHYCEKGQKVIIVVLSEHHHTTTTTTMLLPPSPTHSPTVKAPSHSPSPANNALSDSPSPSNNEPPRHTPTPSPTPTHVSPHSNSPSPLPMAKTPSNSPTEPPTHLMTPSPSPASKPPTHTTVEPPSPLPSPNNNDASFQPDVQHNAPAPHEHSTAFTPHYAPAPAPSAAPSVDVSFIGLVAYTLVFSTLVSIVNLYCLDFQ